MKKKSLLFFTLAFLTHPSFSQTWMWGKVMGGNKMEYGNSIATDQRGNIYVCGSFNSDSLVLGSIVLHRTCPTGYSNLFVAKYDSSGTEIWAKNPPGIVETVELLGIEIHLAADDEGNVYVTGAFQSDSLVFDSIILRNDSANTLDMFIVKYNTNGIVQWAKKGSGNRNYEQGTAVMTDRNKNVYVTGIFQPPSIQFGSINLTNNCTSVTSDVFIVKYDSTGNVIWAKNPHGDFNDISIDLTNDSSGNIFIGGFFNSDSLVWGNKKTYLPTNTIAKNHLFFAKLDSAGNAIWTRSFGGDYHDYPAGIATDAYGNFYATGWFLSASIAFDNFLITNLDSTHVTDDIFVVKLDSVGDVVWVNRYGGNTGDKSQDIAVKPDGSFYFSGYFRSSSITFGGINLNKASSEDLFYTYCDSSGTPLFVSQLTGTENVVIHSDGGNRANSIVFSNTNNDVLYATGTLSGLTLPLGSTTLVNTTQVSLDGFVGKLAGLSTSVKSITSSEQIVYVYPNPFSTSCTIEVNEKLKGKVLTFRLFDSYGRVLMYSTFMELLTIEKNNLATGIYFYTISDCSSLLFCGKISVEN